MVLRPWYNGSLPCRPIVDGLAPFSLLQVLATCHCSQHDQRDTLANASSLSLADQLRGRVGGSDMHFPLGFCKVRG